MKIDFHSYIGNDGIETIGIHTKEPIVNENNLWHGGFVVVFENNHLKQECNVYTFTYSNGAVLGYTKCHKTFKGEILTEAECLKLCEDYYKEV